MNKKIFLTFVLVSATPLLAYENDFYAGIAAGGGILDAGRSVDQQLISPFIPIQIPFIHRNDQYGTNVEGSIVGTWLQRRQNVVFGVNGDVGWGFQRVKATGLSPLPVADKSLLENKLDRGFNLSAMGLLGYECGPWTVALKAGFAGANFTENLKEFHGDDLAQDTTKTTFKPGIGFGAFLDRNVGCVNVRLDYTGAVYESFDQNFVTNGNTLNIEDVKRPVLHRITAGVLWKI